MSGWRRWHRWLALALATPLVVWSVTGLLFHLKPGWRRAYEMLSVERPQPMAWSGPVPPVLRFEKLELFSTALGPLARVQIGGATQLYDGAGKLRSPLSADDARTLAVDGVSRSAFATDYGAVRSVDLEADQAHVHFANRTVDVGRGDAQLSQHGRDTAIIDRLYELHYLKWSGSKMVDRVLALLGLLLIWLALIPGLILFFRRHA